MVSTMRQNILSRYKKCFSSLALFVFGATIFIIFINLDSAILLDENQIIDDKHEMSLGIKKNESTSYNNTASLIVSKCNGNPSERRRLVEKGNDATEQDWLDIIECVEERKKKTIGYYALHVSKSGGKYFYLHKPKSDLMMNKISYCCRLFPDASISRNLIM
jgi:hypothetical protein